MALMVALMIAVFMFGVHPGQMHSAGDGTMHGHVAKQPADAEAGQDAARPSEDPQ